MSCCRPSRRDLLRFSAIATGASLTMMSGRSEATAITDTTGAPKDAVTPVGLELVTLTETGAILTWYTGLRGTDDGLGRMLPARAYGEIVYGTHPRRLNRHVPGGRPTPYHYVELTGLEPGRTYYYQARSAGKAAVATPLNLVGGAAAGTPEDGVFAFTTPLPPPGRHLFSIALCNDLHIGETVAGLVGGIPSIKGISQVPGEPPYAEIMARALVTDAKRRGARYLIAAGDLTNEAAPADVDQAKHLLGAFGRYEKDYFVARGNHDRAHDGTPYAACTPGRWQGHDCFADAFFAAGAPAYFSRDLHGLHVTVLDTYDKPGNGGDAGGLGPEQMAWLRADLNAHRDQPTLVVGHHPLIAPDSPLAATGGASLDAGQALEIGALYAKSPGVFLHHAGHTHRNKHTVLFPPQPAPHQQGLPGTGNVIQQEVGAVKEYPGGFTLLRIHTGGYALNHYKTRDLLAREWSERSRQEISGLWPQLSLGPQVSDRNSVAAHDFSGLLAVAR